MFLRTELVRKLYAHGARCAVLVLAMAVLLGVVRSGARYVYCPMMDAVLATSCCDRGESHGDAPAVEAPECCQAKRLGAMPASGTTAVAVDLGDVPFTTLLPPFVAAHAVRSTPGAFRFEHPARAGPVSARERRAQLMIWTC